jgi:homopolymeric O-antigen transport system permease protein
VAEPRGRRYLGHTRISASIWLLQAHQRMNSMATKELDRALEEEGPASTSNASVAWHDLTDGIRKYWIWSALAMQDIRLRYRGSVLGPFWLTLSTAVMVAAMGFLYPHLFKVATSSYLPFLVTGLVIWQFVSLIITDGCQTFSSMAQVIQQVPLPFSVYVYRTVYRNLIILAHNFVIVPIILVIFHAPIDWRVLEIFPALALLAVNGIWIAILFGIVSARFRDIPPVIASFLQVAFFVTPIFWPIKALGKWGPLAALNPLFAAVDIVRAPLLGLRPEPYSWIVVFVFALIGSVFTFAFFTRFRRRIAYWV